MFHLCFDNIRKIIRSPKPFLSAGMAEIRNRPQGYVDHVLVHAMAKVGSSTIVRTLQNVMPRAYVQHTHSLSVESLHIAEKCFDRMLAPRWKQLDKSRAISRIIRHPPFPIQWKVISPVRDPIARDVSFFFECLPLLCPELTGRSDCRVSELLDAFYKYLDEHSPMHFVPHPLHWFDDEIVPLFNIDIYSTPYDHERGFSLYESENARLLVIRLEDFSSSLSDALQSLLCLNRVKIENSNRAIQKTAIHQSYSLYPEFRKQVRFSDRYLDNIYMSKFCNHFYRCSEIERFRSTWKRKAGTAA